MTSDKPVSVNLVETATRDGVVLGGIAVEPAGKKRAALIWVHGLSSAFYHGLPLMRELSAACSRRNIGYFKFNNRGHDVIAKGTPSALAGVAFEDFKKCVFDIRAMIAFVRRHGYRDVFLAGHSTGANKIAYYQYRTNDRRVKGLVLAAGISDIASESKTPSRARELRSVVRRAERLVQEGRGRELMTLRNKVYSASRIVSLYKPGQAEDVFPVYNPRVPWTAMRSVRVPTLVVFGSRDAFMDRDAGALIDLYRAHMVNVRQYAGRVVRGADHGFQKKEKELARVVSDWIRRVGRGRE